MSADIIKACVCTTVRALYVRFLCYPLENKASQHPVGTSRPFYRFDYKIWGLNIRLLFKPEKYNSIRGIGEKSKATLLNTIQLFKVSLTNSVGNLKM